MELNTLKDRVIKFLYSENISNSEFAERAGLSAPYVHTIKKNISFDVLHKLYLINPRVNLSWLLWGEGEMYLNNQSQIKILQEENARLKDKLADVQKIANLQSKVLDRIENAK